MALPLASANRWGFPFGLWRSKESKHMAQKVSASSTVSLLVPRAGRLPAPSPSRATSADDAGTAAAVDRLPAGTATGNEREGSVPRVLGVCEAGSPAYTALYERELAEPSASAPVSADVRSSSSPTSRPTTPRGDRECSGFLGKYQRGRTVPQVRAANRRPA